MRKGNRGQIPRSLLKIDPRHHSLAKFALSIALGISIFAGVFIANEQTSSMLRQDVENSKQVVTDSLHKLADRKERRLETIASGIIGFYKASNSVEPDSFREFVQGITRVTPDLKFIIVEDND